MAKDFTHVFEDLEDDLRSIYDDAKDRFGDERDEHPHYEQPVTPSCGGCDHYIPCDVPGYEGVGWCTLFGAFYTSDNPFDECWEVD